jgi:hypothetical protein
MKLVLAITSAFLLTTSAFAGDLSTFGGDSIPGTMDFGPQIFTPHRAGTPGFFDPSTFGGESIYGAMNFGFQYPLTNVQAFNFNTLASGYNRRYDLDQYGNMLAVPFGY